MSPSTSRVRSTGDFESAWSPHRKRHGELLLGTSTLSEPFSVAPSISSGPSEVLQSPRELLKCSPAEPVQRALP